MLYRNREEAYRAYRESPEAFFDRYHRETADERGLISPDWEWYATKYHYNLVENGIIDLLLESGRPVKANAVLDLGSGTGHWIDFYRLYLEAAEVVGLDFSEVCVAKLAARCAGVPGVQIHRRDVSEFVSEYEARFDVVNAIGLMFHIVDDARWSRTVENACRYLKPRGLAIVGGDFGDESVERGVMRKTRSRRRWEEELARVGARIVDVKKFDWFRGGVNGGLKNNLLAFERLAEQAAR